MAQLDRTVGASAFGDDPANYHAARPDYPGWVFDALRARCGLRPGVSAFEVGAGTGKATRGLLDLGAAPLVAIEPDSRLAAYLRNSLPSEALTVVQAPFETAAFDRAGFDLGVSATAFHWLNERAALARVAELLRPGGWWAMVWNLFGDAARADPFHEATKDLLKGPHSPSEGVRGQPFALDAPARRAALMRTGAFEAFEHQTSAWTLTLDPDQVAALYATYSNVTTSPDRARLLSELHRITRDDFGGRVERNMITSLFIARRR